MNRRMARFSWQYPDSIPKLRGDTLLMATDDSGSHKESKVQIVSFYLLNARHLSGWDNERIKIRQQYQMSYERSFGYKKLNDNIRRRATPPFIRLANRTPGLLFVVAIDKRVQIHDLLNTDLMKEYSNALGLAGSWNDDMLDRMFMHTFFAAFLCGGLTDKDQVVMWHMDQDPVNDTKYKYFDTASLASFLRGKFQMASISGIAVSTNAMDDPTRRFEDLTAVADLSAGVWFDMLSERLGQGREYPLGYPDQIRKTPDPLTFRGKAADIVRTFSERGQLRKIFFACNFGADGRIHCDLQR